MPTVAPGSRIASPVLARSRRAMILRSDDLPVPFGPTTLIFAPCTNERVTLSRTTLSPWAFRTLRRVNTYSAMGPEPTGRGAVRPILGGCPGRPGAAPGRPLGTRGHAAGAEST